MMRLLTVALSRRLKLIKLGMIAARLRVEGGPWRQIDPVWLPSQMTKVARRKLSGGFFVRDLAGQPTWSGDISPGDATPSGLEMRDVAAVGEDYERARIYQYYLICIEMGRPVYARGDWIDTPEKAKAYYLRYVELYRSLQAQGYKYSDDDPIKIGITATGDFVHITGGINRTAAARLLGLPLVQAQIVAVDIDWALACSPTASNLTYEQLMTAIDDVLRLKRADPADRPAYDLKAMTRLA